MLVSANALGQTLALLATFLGIGVLANALIVYIVDHLDEAAFQTAEELARRASTSSSTVVRFSQALGFEGFPELQQAARDEYRRRPPNGSEMPAAAPLFSLDHTEFEAALAADHVNVEDT